MYYLFIVAFGAATALVPFFLVFALSARWQKRHGIKPAASHFWLALVFAVYLCGVFHFTGAGTLYDLLRQGIEINKSQMNFIPFSQDVFPVSRVLNVILFVPFGFLLPPVWPRANRFAAVLLGGLSFSLLIELSQFLNHRNTDVDDLILNTLGAAIGFFAFRLLCRVVKWQPTHMDYPKWEPFFTIGAMFLGRFLLFNEMRLAQIFFGVVPILM